MVSKISTFFKTVGVLGALSFVGAYIYHSFKKEFCSHSFDMRDLVPLKEHMKGCGYSELPWFLEVFKPKELCAFSRTFSHNGAQFEHHVRFVETDPLHFSLMSHVENPRTSPDHIWADSNETFGATLLSDVLSKYFPIVQPYPND